MKILVLNCYSRNALSVISSIDNSYEIYGGFSFVGSLKKRLCQCFKSDRVKELIYITPPSVDIEQFKNDIIHAVNKLQIDIIIPTGTSFTDSLSFFKEKIMMKTRSKILVEDYQKLEMLTDKWKFAQLCQEMDIPIPKTVVLKRVSNLNQERIEARIDYPYIVKPRKLQAAEGVFLFHSESDFDENYSRLLKDYAGVENGSFLIQEMIMGSLHDVTSCAKSGRALSILSQQRMATWYDFGGGGIINKTTYETKIIEFVKKILKKMEWNGIAEFDFIKNANGEFFALECNPKFWGTTQLTIDAGANMPQQLIDFWVHGKDVQPITSYKVGLLYKWLFPYCFLHCLHKPLTIDRFFKRIKKIFKDYGCENKSSNIQIQYMKHILGSIISNTPL
nr:ATP-grasp domain-containing protein [uncultured Desulfobacter sp.]